MGHLHARRGTCRGHRGSAGTRRPGIRTRPSGGRHGVRIAPPNTRDGYREEFLGHVRSSLEGDDRGRADSLGIVREWMLRNRGWDGVARQWEGLFADRMGRS